MGKEKKPSKIGQVKQGDGENHGCTLASGDILGTAGNSTSFALRMVLNLSMASWAMLLPGDQNKLAK